MDFSEKKIFVTGGSAGIGKAIVADLISRGATHIAIMGRKQEKLIEMQGRYDHITFLMVKGDVSNPEDLKKAINHIQKNWHGLDIIVNNAGVVSAGALDTISDDDIINQININLTGLILLTKYALPLLKSSTDGAIVNISSGLGLIGMPFYTVYAATKAGVRQFSESLRRELHNLPIHVMTAYPTVTDTDMMHGAVVNKKMDSPAFVAKEIVDSMLEKKINVIFGGEQRLKDNEENFRNPEEFDEKVADKFDEMKKRTENHRAM